MTVYHTLAELAQTMEEKQADPVILLDVHGCTLVSDYFLICACSNVPQIKAVHAAAKEKLSQQKTTIFGEEGDASSGWMLIDCSTIIIHIFSSELYRFYNIEDIWADAKQINWKAKYELHQKNNCT